MVKRTKSRQSITQVPTWQDTVLKRLIDEHAISENDAMRAHRAGRVRSLYASDYGQCMLKVWYQFFPDEFPAEKLSPRTLRIFHNGEAVHNRLSKYLMHASVIEFSEEIDIPRDALDVHGRCDGFALIDGVVTIIEFKSINKAIVYEPVGEHVGQLTWYMVMWELHRQKLLDEKNDLVLENLSSQEKQLLVSQDAVQGEIIYESKHTQETFHFPVVLDNQKIKQVHEWFVELKHNINVKTLPIVDYSKDKYPCSWGFKNSKTCCPYYSLCYK